MTLTDTNQATSTGAGWQRAAQRALHPSSRPVDADVLAAIAAGLATVTVPWELRDWLRRLHDKVHVTTVFVTHDQEEAMEVADEIVVINNGAVEQIGTPDQLYDQPVNDFVMNFLGPVTTLGGVAVRPHDIEILTDDAPDAVPATVVRLVRLGFEVRVDAVSQGHDVWVQISRAEADRLDLTAGSEVFLRPVTARRDIVAAH